MSETPMLVTATATETPVPVVATRTPFDEEGNVLLYQRHLVESIGLLGEDATDEQVGRSMMLAELLGQWLKERIREIEEKALDRIQTHGDIVLGSVRYYAAIERIVKCRDVRKAIEALLEVSGGDMDAMVECLSSNAIKHGATRKLLDRQGQPQRFDELFETVEKTVLKDGKPNRNGKVLQKVDERFIR